MQLTAGNRPLSLELAGDRVWIEVHGVSANGNTIHLAYVVSSLAVGSETFSGLPASALSNQGRERDDSVASLGTIS